MRLIASALALVAALAGATPARAARWFDAPLAANLCYAASSEDWPSRLACGDVDGDGVLDVVTNTVYTVWLHRGLGDGTFAGPEAVYETRTAYLTLVDFDGDGALDVVDCAFYEPSCVLFGDGTGHGWTKVELPVPAWPSGQTHGDVDHDGRPEVIVFGADGGIEVVHCLPGRVLSATHTRSDSARSSFLFSAVPADFDQDGDLDLALSAGGGYEGVTVLRGHGDGTFSARRVEAQMAAGYLEPARGLVATDATRDGIPDLVVAHRNAIVVHPGLGDGTFGAPMVLDTEAECARDVVVADVTGDGLPDLVSDAMYTLELVTRPGLPAGGFGPPIRSRTGQECFPLAVVDLDGDERPDVLAHANGDYGSPGAYFSALGDGAGRFGVNGRTRFGPPYTEPLGVGDFDEDGRTDLVMRHRTWQGDTTYVDLWLARPGRAFVLGARRECPFTIGLSEPPVLDLDEDGHLDLVHRGRAGMLTVWRGAGDGTWADTSNLELPAADGYFEFADTDGDGHLDLVLAQGTSLWVRRCLGGGVFSAPILTPSGDDDITGLRVGDLDGDGRADVYARRVLRYTATSFTDYSLSLGDGHFGAPIRALDDPSGLSALVDLDDDGHEDLVLVDSPGVTYEGALVRVHSRIDASGLGPAITSEAVAPEVGVLGPAIDLDGDGHPDLSQRTDWGGMVLRGDGAGHLGAATGFGGLTSYGPRPVPFADFDGDGRLDVVGADDSTAIVFWGRDPVRPTVALLGPGALPALVPGAPATVRWSASDDIGVASIDLFVSRHGPRGPFERVALGLPDTGEHAWTVTGPLSDSVAFKVVARDSAGNVAHAVSAERLRIVDAAAVDAMAPPTRLAITSVAPNPLRLRLTTRFALPRAGRVTLALHDLQGRRVATLLDGTREAGTHAIDWAPREAVPPGLYFLRLTAGREHTVARVIVAR